MMATITIESKRKLDLHVIEIFQNRTIYPFIGQFLKKGNENLVLDTNYAIKHNGLMTSLNIVQTINSSIQTKPTNNSQLNQSRSCTTIWHLGSFDIVEIHVPESVP
ncbi:unnamed protein product, partial [Vitis vinifera]